MSNSEVMIINELLTFIQNKVDVMDEVAIVQICATQFSEEEVETAKEVIFSYAAERKVQRKGEMKKNKNLLDIIKAIKESEDDVLPIFVAKDLHKLPPVNFDHVDVTCLLKDIISLKQEISIVKSQMIRNTDIQELKNEMSLLRNTQVTKENKIHEAKNVQQVHKIEEQDKLNTYKDALIKNVVPRRSSVHEESVSAQKFQCTEVCETDIQKKDNETRARQSYENQNKYTVRDGDGFVEVKRKRIKRNFFATGKQADNSEPLKIAEMKSSLYISRFDKSVTVNNIENYIKTKGSFQTVVEQIKQTRETSFVSFKVEISRKDIKEFMNKGFWPEGVVYRKYINRNYGGQKTENNINKL